MLSNQTSYEHDLLDGLKRGDDRAQQELYSRYVDAMFHTTLRIVGTHHDAQDATQECFIKVYQNIGRYRGDSTLGAWIKRIAVNSAINTLRKKQRQLEYPSEDIQTVSDTHRTEYREEALDPSVVHNEILRLPNGCRAVLNLYAFEGYSHREIAQILSIAESTSKTQYRRAKALLKIALEAKVIRDEY